MRILLVSAIYPPDIGGPATYTKMLLDGLRSRGHTVHVIAGGRGPAEKGVTRIRRERPFFWIAALAKFAVAPRRFDIALAAGLYDSVALAWAKPWIAKVAGDEAWERAHRFGWTRDSIDSFQTRRYDRRIEGLKAIRNRSLRRARCVVVPSRYLQRMAKGWGVKAEVIPNAVDVGQRRSIATEPVFVSAGRFVPHKGFLELVRAFRGLQGVRLEIYGDGPERNALEQAAHGLPVRILPPLPHEELMDRIASARALILNSTYEGLPHLLLESLALGTPVIARRAGGTEELMTGCGLLVSSHEELRQAIAKLHHDSELRDRLSTAGIKRSAAFSVDATVAATEAILHQAVLSRSARRCLREP
ncbi:MAG TPA: glycosyltransferase family 4 protein [Planctomycetota bacterium]|nr:glycosyltransferase family 4 protein [Planctomycetota bacterium]